MKLYFRLLLLWLNLRKTSNITVDDTSVFHSRVWPTDLDFNGHMTNTRYANLFDLSHIQLFSQLGLIPTLKQKRWSPVINARTISYFKELSPFEAFTVTSRLIYWDRNYFYMEQRILNQAGKTSAISYSRELLVDKSNSSSKGIVSFKDALIEAHKVGGVSVSQARKDFDSHSIFDSPEIPEHIKHWKETLSIQKKMAKSQHG
ncbi:thioesterase family protein [Litoribrevibacter euphylliae]|uniref:Thioesterase family protein n=1 Tax=Litoribrevibacter euphylliae TaxID=1834034 RepID=A0ABV7H7E8_9GAMM